MARICMLNHNAWSVLSGAGAGPVGGEEVQHALLSRDLARRGHQVTSLVGDFGQQSPLQLAGVTVRKTFATDAGLPGLRFFTPRLTATWAALKAADADAYYVSCAGAVVGIMAAFCRRHRRRFVFRIASDADCAPQTLMLGNARDRLLYHYGVRRADAILAQSTCQVRLLRHHYGLAATLAGMFADLPASVPGFEARGTDLLWLANLRAMKRPAWFVELARALPQRCCVMAGGAHHGEAQHYAAISAAALALPNLRFLGPLPHAATAPLFAAARLFVNTSSLEGFPNTYLQAWAHGTPVIATFDPDGVIGALGLGVAVTDVGGAARAAQTLLGDPQAWAACSARCRQHAAARLGPDTVSAPYLAAMVTP